MREMKKLNFLEVCRELAEPKNTLILFHTRPDGDAVGSAFALKLLLDIAFNSDELLLELSISSTYEIEEDRHYKHPIPPEDQETALQYFHSVLAEIYAQILNERETE